MKKYLEYFPGDFDSTVADKMKPENKPYVAYSKTEGVVFTIIPEEPTSAYQMVDLGLPSGLKWADRNVGAETPQDSGLYFSWGNIDGHAVDENGNVTDGYSFDSDTYSTTSGGQYTGSTLDTEHDAATANMGSGWRMPTSTETAELVQETDHYYIDLEGNILNKDGFIIDENGNTTEDKIELSNSKKLRSICFVQKGEAFIYNDRSNFIEIPFAGYCSGSLLHTKGLDGQVWSSSVNTALAAYWARFLNFGSSGSLLGDTSSDRFGGRSVRGVCA